MDWLKRKRRISCIPDLRTYYGRDYNSHVLEEWLSIHETAQNYCAPMTHEQYGQIDHDESHAYQHPWD